MGVVDEKDYIMRMIKEMVQVLFSLVFGKKYVSVELEDENKYEVSGNTLKYFFDMIDQGDINEAENLLLEDLDYTNKEEVMAAAFFYQHLSQKDDVLFGFKQLLEKSGYKDLIRLIGRVDEEER